MFAQQWVSRGSAGGQNRTGSKSEKNNLTELRLTVESRYVLFIKVRQVPRAAKQ